MDRQPAAGARLLELIHDMRSFPHFSNWLGMTIAGIEWEQSEVVFNCPQNAVMSICFCNLSGLHHVSQENGIDALTLFEIP
jgi:hypothetical protein